MKTPPQPRNDRVGRELATLHERLYRAMRDFLKDLERAEHEYHLEVAEQRAKFGVDAHYTETTDVQRYSLAIQLFAALTTEAAISLYAVLQFGGDKHDDHFRWGEADKRLQKALRFSGIHIADDAEIFALVRTIMEARHAIAHPFRAEYLGSEQASIRAPDRHRPDDSATGARQAIANVDRFLELLRSADEPESLTFTIC